MVSQRRWRLSLADGERLHDELEAQPFEGPAITVPTIGIGSDLDGANVDGHTYSQRALEGIGHNVAQEAPEACADAILKVGGAR